ncbi:MAG TPA: hypothetical protein DEO32_04435 [Ruminococcaceae bacterium]|nr:hypothetical protein [Oscillospiraceae bacterium]
MIEQELNKLLRAARQDDDLKKKLIETKNSDNPVEDFCAIGQSLGCKITAGELFCVGMTASDAKLRSVNGGGVNAIDGWDDAYEQFIMTLEWT